MATEYPRTALITGASKRIGRAIALALAADGWQIALHHGNSHAAAIETLREIETAGGRAMAVQADLGDREQAARLVDQAVEAVGPLTLLVNNASTFENDTVETVTRESWDLHMEVNLWSPFALSQAFARQLPDGAEGNIVNLLDQRVWNLTPYFMSYTVSKSGLWTLTRTLALALAPRIRVNAIGPGPALPSTHQTDQEFTDQCARMPLRRGTTPGEIASTVRYILASPSLTGQMIALDGGQHLGWRHGTRDSDD